VSSFHLAQEGSPGSVFLNLSVAKNVRTFDCCTCNQLPKKYSDGMVPHLSSQDVHLRQFPHFFFNVLHRKELFRCLHWSNALMSSCCYFGTSFYRSKPRILTEEIHPILFLFSSNNIFCLGSSHCTGCCCNVLTMMFAPYHAVLLTSARLSIRLLQQNNQPTMAVTMAENLQQ
jgi:hypothetical protein